MTTTIESIKTTFSDDLVREANDRLTRIESRKKRIMTEYIKLGDDLRKIYMDYNNEPELAAKIYQEESWEYICKRVGYHHKSAERIISNTNFINECEQLGINLEEITQIGNLEKLAIIRRYFQKHSMDKVVVKHLIEMAIALPDQSDFSKEVKSLDENNFKLQPPPAKIHWEEVFEKLIEYFSSESTQESFMVDDICKIITKFKNDYTY